MSSSLPAYRQYTAKAATTHEITRMYLDSQLTADEATARLDERPDGAFMSGEICLEESSRSTLFQADYLLKAKSYYREVIDEPITEFNQQAVQAVQARVRMAQLPVLMPILRNRSLPDASVVNAAYAETVDIGNCLANLIQTRIGNRKTDAFHRAIGYMSEVAVLALSQRYAKNAEITDCWLPTQSLLAGDYGRMGYSHKTGNGRDMDIWTEAVNRSPDLAYKIQVKASSNSPMLRPYSREVQVVNLYPDLCIPGMSSDIPIGTSILRDCVVEIERQGNSYQATRRLEARTERLLTKIES